MAWGEMTGRKEELPTWCLVQDNCTTTCITIFGETKEARDQRLAGEVESDGKTVVRELDAEMSSFVNRIRESGDFHLLVSLVAAVSSEAAQQEAKRMRDIRSNSSIA